MTFTVGTNSLAPTTAEESTSDTALAFSPIATVAGGLLAVLPVVWDNVDGTNADDTTKLSVSDTKGNTWIRAGEAQYSAGSALDGVLTGVFYSVISTSILTSDTITITSTANGTGKGATLVTFNRDTGKTISVAGKGYERVSNALAYTVTVSGLASEEHLWIGVNGMERGPANVNTIDATFTQITQDTDTAFGHAGGGGDAGIGGRAGYKIATGPSETYDNTGLTQCDRCTALVAFVEVAPAGGGVADPFGMSGFFGG
jgi:hypothetical protein